MSRNNLPWISLSEYLYGNNLPRISLIHGKLFPYRYTPYSLLLISTVFVVVSNVGYLKVTRVFFAYLKSKIHFIQIVLIFYASKIDQMAQ